MMLKYTIYISLFLFCCNIRADISAPPLFKSSYELIRDGVVIGELNRSLSKQGTHFLVESESNMTGLISLFYSDHIQEKSRWHIQRGLFRPLEYNYLRERKNKTRQVKIKFDWDKKRIFTNVNGSVWNMPIEEDIFDKLLYQIAIMQYLNAGIDVNKFKVADGGKLKTYYFNNLGEEQINTPLGTFKSIKLERHKSNSKKKLIFWCAKDLSYLPIKVENIDKEGKTVTALIKTYSKQ